MTFATLTCAPCDHNAVHGWWGPTVGRGTHCRGCHRSWLGLAEGHCTVCHLHFGKGDTAWDAHFDGARHRSLGEVTGLRTEAGEPRFKVIDRASGPVILRHDARANPFASVDQ